MSNIIEVRDLKKTFITPMARRRVPVLKGLNFDVKEGHMVGFLGVNGAGKTTTLKTLLGFIKKDSGSFKIPSKEEIGFLTERPYFYDYLTGFEFLTFCSKLFKKEIQPSYINQLLEEVGLAHAAHRRLRSYSKGMLQRAGMAQALLNSPKLLILDEPMSGLDPDGRAAMLQLMKKAHENGTTVFFSSHLISDIETYCDEVVIIHSGKLVIQNPVKELLSKYATGYLLETKQGDRSEENVFDNEAALQVAIDSARRKQININRVTILKPSLEEVFLKIKGEHIERGDS